MVWSFAYILWGIGGFCVLGAISERKDLMRMVSFLLVSVVFFFIGWAITL